MALVLMFVAVVLPGSLVFWIICQPWYLTYLTVNNDIVVVCHKLNTMYLFALVLDTAELGYIVTNHGQLQFQISGHRDSVAIFCNI